MNSFHMIKEIPPAWEAVILLGAVAVFEVAQMGFGSVSMHPVGFPFVTEEACS